MTAWSLGAKLTAWSALVVGALVLIVVGGVTVFLYEEQVEALDDALRSEAASVLSEWQIDGAESAWEQRKLADRLMESRQGPRFIEMIDASGASLFRSANLRDHQIATGLIGLRTDRIGSARVRLGVFREGDQTVVLGASLAEIDDDTKALVLATGAALPLLMGGAVLGGWILARKATEPVRAIARVAEEITAEQLHRRLPELPRNDELGRLTALLNAMLERLEKGFQQAARFSADASHELKTPLTILRLSIEDLLESAHLPSAAQREVAALLEQTRRLISITDSLLLLARADAGRLALDRASADISGILQVCIEDARILGEPRAIVLEAALPPALTANVDAGRLNQIVVNLLDNAVKYNRPGGTVRIEGQQLGEGIEIRVGNSGRGIPEDHAPHIFERFYRPSGVEEAPGQGLGLSLSRELARAHGGELEMTSSSTDWTEFRLTIPG